MITIEHLEIYKKYNGDGDALIRCATSREKEIMGYTHWSLIDNLAQDLFLVEKGLASNSFIEFTNKKLKECCDDENTIQYIKNMVSFLK